MKKILLTLALLLVTLIAKADQLAYISKEQAMQAAEVIKKSGSIVSFCGCCDGVKPKKIKVDQIIVRYTGYESYYEVIVISKGKEIALDMAYTWVKFEKHFKTVGEVCGFEHDPCKRYKS